jgi:TRAP-type C4-dicarboxylate transport system permease small subunit
VYAQVSDWTPLDQGGCMVDGVPTLKCFELVFQNILNIASALIIVVLFIMLINGAFHYLTSLGNPEKLKKAQGTLRYAVIGLVIFLAAFLILNVIDVLFLGGHGNLFRFKIGD